MPTIVIKGVAAMDLAEKQSEGLLSEHRLGLTVNNILPDSDANKVFTKIGSNIVGV